MGDREPSAAEDVLSDPDLVRGLVETSPVGIAVVDAEGEVIFVNERAEAIYGRQQEEIAGFVHDDARLDLVDRDGEPIDDGAAPFDQVLRNEESIYDRVIGLRRPDGERV